MAEETVQEQTQQAPENRVESRIKDLSGKVEMTAKERDEAIALAEKAQREAGFYKEFSGQLASFPQAAQFQDQIKERVMKGYTVTDATFAVLGQNNQLNMKAQVDSPVGGSAVNQPANVKKSIREMTQAEKLEMLRQAEKEGYISLS